MLTILTQAAALAGQPNVVLIMTDDQGYADMSCHGNPYLKTPNIDELYRESVRLADFHVDPTCSPTRAALMTGRYSSRVGVWLTYGGRHHLRVDEVTMADVFADAGYRTAIFGKWHLGDNYPFRPQDRGFQESLIHGGGVAGEAPDYWGNDYFDDTYFRNGVPESVNGYCTDVWFDEAIRFIEQAKDRPFFVYLPTNAPHGPRNVPRKYVEPFLQKGVGSRFCGAPSGPFGKTTPDPFLKPLNESVARFYGMIVNIDQNIGRLRRRLAELGLSGNTIVIFLTDNGGTGGVRLYNAGMRGSKAKAYDGGHRAACFIHWPKGGMTEGRAVEPITAHIDLLPTLIELCDLRSTRRVKFDGKSLVSLLNGNAISWPDRTLFVHHQGRFGQKITDDRPIKYKDYAVMTDRWRLVGKELYDIKAEPGQKADVASAHTDVVTRLSAAYETWWSDIGTKFDEYCPTIIGSEKQARTVLTCQDWHGEVIPYNQQHVRAGVQANGFWDLEVARGGVYRISLRRWPEEADKAIGAFIEQDDLDPAKIDVNARLYQMPGQAIRATKARLKVGAFDETRPVKPTDKAITFDVELDVGRVNLQTWLTDDEGKSWGAYYVYIERL